MASATPDLRLPSQPQGIISHWLVPNYTAWWQRHMYVNNLPRVALDSGAAGIDPMTYWLQVQHPTATPPSHTRLSEQLDTLCSLSLGSSVMHSISPSVATNSTWFLLTSLKARPVIFWCPSYITRCLLCLKHNHHPQAHSRYCYNCIYYCTLRAKIHSTHACFKQMLCSHSMFSAHNILALINNALW